MNKKKKKVIFKDNERIKTAVGTTDFEEGFVKVTDESGSSIYINKQHVVLIKDILN